MLEAEPQTLATRVVLRNVGIAIISLPFWDGLHHLFMVVFGGGLLLR